MRRRIWSQLLALFALGLRPRLASDPQAGAPLAPAFKSLRKMREASRYFKKTLLPAAYQELEVTEALRGLFYCDLKVGKNKRAMSYLLETFLSEATNKKTERGYFLKEKTFTPLFQWWLRE